MIVFFAYILVKDNGKVLWLVNLLQVSCILMLYALIDYCFHIVASAIHSYYSLPRVVFLCIIVSFIFFQSLAVRNPYSLFNACSVSLSVLFLLFYFFIFSRIAIFDTFDFLIHLVNAIAIMCCWSFVILYSQNF